MPRSHYRSASFQFLRKWSLCLLTAMLGLVSGVQRAVAVPVGAPPVVPCASAVYHQLDFWLGDWRVYDGDSGRLVAEDRITKRLADCVIEQNLTFVTDMYRRPGVSYRLSGMSISRFDGERWLQLWTDDQWGAIIMRGAASRDGTMVFDTVIPSRGRDVRLVWKRESPKVVRILQYVAPTGSGKWTKYGDLLYRLVAGSQPQASVDASTPCRRSASANGVRCAP